MQTPCLRCLTVFWIHLWNDVALAFIYSFRGIFFSKTTILLIHSQSQFDKKFLKFWQIFEAIISVSKSFTRAFLGAFIMLFYSETYLGLSETSMKEFFTKIVTPFSHFLCSIPLISRFNSTICVRQVLNPFLTTGLLLYPLKRKKTRGFLMFSGSIERDKWHKMG